MTENTSLENLRKFYAKHAPAGGEDGPAQDRPTRAVPHADCMYTVYSCTPLRVLWVSAGIGCIDRCGGGLLSLCAGR